jgi:hypothetical protein
LPALLIAGLILCAPRDDPWEVIGPGGGGSQFYPSVSPHDAKRVLVACDMTGSYLTEDGGTRWRMFNLGGTTRFFEWDPNNANVIYAGSNGLYRSADRGKSWNLLFPAAGQVTRVEAIDDSAFEARIVGGSQAPPITALAIDPGRSETLYAAFGRTLRVSEDTGATWRTEREFPDAVRHMWAAKDLLYVTSDRSLDIREKGVGTRLLPPPHRGSISPRRHRCSIPSPRTQVMSPMTEGSLGALSRFPDRARASTP